MLAAEVSFCKKEVFIQKSEQDTIVDVAVGQAADIERYLKKEITILDDVIKAQSIRQKAEFSRLNQQVLDVKNIKEELEASRMENVCRLIRV